MVLYIKEHVCTKKIVKFRVGPKWVKAAVHRWSPTNWGRPTFRYNSQISIRWPGIQISKIVAIIYPYS